MPLRARDIADICDDLAIERASVTVMGGWDPDATQFTLSFGPIGYRQTMVIDPKWEVDEVKSKLMAAQSGVPAEVLIKVAPLPMAVITADMAAMDIKASAAKPAQKRKKANARP